MSSLAEFIGELPAQSAAYELARRICEVEIGEPDGLGGHELFVVPRRRGEQIVGTLDYATPTHQRFEIGIAA